jgi:hypothetical protein
LFEIILFIRLKKIKIEISTGVHPYSLARGVFGLSTAILEEPSPQLDPESFTASFCDFVDKW